MEGSTNPSKKDHYIAFDPWEGIVEFSVYPYVDEVAEPNTDELDAEITFIGINKYTTGTPCSTVEINDPPSCSAFVTLSDTSTSIAERESATLNFTRTGGDTTAPLTVNIRVDYLEDFLRGNHCDPEPDIPTTVELPPTSPPRPSLSPPRTTGTIWGV